MKLRMFLFVFLTFSNISCVNNDLNEEKKYMIYIKDILDCMNMPRPSDSYNYPIFPGTEKWNSYNTTQEMIDACQIPKSILLRQTTQAVFQGLWEYPFFFEITLRYDHYQADFETVFNNTLAYNEFITRKDAGQSLYSRLLLVNPKCTLYSRGLELFMSQSIFLQQLNKDEKIKIIIESFKNDSIRQAANDFMEDVSREVTWLLIGRALLSSDYSPFVDLVNNNNQLKSFLESSTIDVTSKEEYESIIQLIISNGQTFIH